MLRDIERETFVFLPPVRAGVWLTAVFPSWPEGFPASPGAPLTVGAEVTDVCSQLLRIQTQILELVQKVLYPPSHPTVPDGRLLNTLTVLDGRNSEDGVPAGSKRFPAAH